MKSIIYPRFSGDQSPKSKAGLVIGMADRLDSLAGLFAVGSAPTGTKDPFGLRRSAIGLVQNLINANLEFDLRQGLEFAAEALKGTVDFPADKQNECLAFIVSRLENYLLEKQQKYDIVAAVLAEQGHTPFPGGAGHPAIDQLGCQDKDWNTILPAYARCVRITRDQKSQFTLNPEILTDAARKRAGGRLIKFSNPTA